MMAESSKPLAPLTASIVELKLKTPPGGITAPTNFSEATSMLYTRVLLLPLK